MTAREVSVVIESARWRQQQAARFALIGAWQTAVFMRSKKLPQLKTLLRRMDRAASAPRRQNPEEVWRTLKAFAADNGLRITRHKTPIPRPVFH